MKWFLGACLIALALLVGIGIYTRGPTWVEHSSSKFHFKVLMPGTPDVRRMQPKDGAEAWLATVTDDDGEYGVLYRTCGLDDKVIATGNWSAARDAFLDRFGDKYGVRVTHEAESMWQGKHRCLTMDIHSKELNMKARIRWIISAEAFFDLMVSARPDWSGWKHADRFLDSFEVLP